jgi:hypothetical protein
LFRKRYAHLDKCPVCGLSRWKDEERNKIPQKLLRHFPLAPRLKRLFATKEASLLAQWHDRQQQPSEKEMSHPGDGDAWQDFDKEYPKFARDVRNIRLGFATDGFNPFFRTEHKIQHVSCVCGAIQPSTLGMHGGVQLYYGSAYTRS